MKTKFLLLLNLFLILSEDVFSQSRSHESPNHVDVNSIKEDVYSAVEYFDSVIKGDLISKRINVYQKDGGYEIIETDSDDSIKYRYTYNKAIDEAIIFWRMDYLPSYLGADGTKHYRYHRNRLGKVIETNTYLPNGKLIEKTTFLLDAKGNISERKNYNADGSLKLKEIIKTNENGTKEEFSYKIKNDSLYLETTTLIKYDIKGNEIERSNFHGDTKKINDKWKYRYNDTGDIIEIEFESSFLNFKQNFEYKYDQRGNWIEKVEYKGFVPKEITIRQIKYFDE
jgi:hypothetical protein